MWFNNLRMYAYFNMLVVKLLLVTFMFYLNYAKDMPKLIGSENNVTVVIGRDATLTCSVTNLQNFKIAWLRVDTQTILTIGPHVITKNHRVGVKCGDQTWSLILRDVRLTDDGQYMCQINTEPMITQTHHLLVSVPPDIVNSSSSGEVIVYEGDNVSLHCTASGTPTPAITWRREDSALMKIGNKIVVKWSGVWLNMLTVNRDMNGAFLCIASNGIPPSVSKRIILRVLCKPTVWMAKKMAGAYLGETTTVKCNIEAFPPPIVYWTHMDGEKLQNDSKHQMFINSQSYRHIAEFKINNISREDIGLYYCYAENQLGSSHADMTLYTLATTTSSTTTIKTTTMVHAYVELDVSVHDTSQSFPEEDNFVVVLSQHQMQSLDLTPSL